MTYDVAIIGAGPCGLAAAARLREPSPSALFTEIEHDRFWNRRHDKNTIDSEIKKAKAQSKQCGHPSYTVHSAENSPSLIVFDAHSNQWMSSWREKFSTLNISHLRSPLFFHPDPLDRDGLLAFAHDTERTAELCEIENVVGREGSKHKLKKRRSGNGGQCNQSARHLHLDNRDYNDYFTPSSHLFNSYIESIVKRYDLSNLIHHTNITNISYDTHPQSTTKLFTITTSTGQTHHARSIILATGPNNPPRIPPTYPLLSNPNHPGSANHILDPTHPLLPSHLTKKLTCNPTYQPKILIIGGGLTSAQTTSLLLTTHPKIHIHLVLRSRLKIKHFDVDLAWVTKLRNRHMAQFWAVDTDHERVEMLRAAKGGGSVTPEHARVLKRWIGLGRLVVHAEMEVAFEGEDRDGNKGTKWNDGLECWDVLLQPSSASSSARGLEKERKREVEVIGGVDHIVFATSSPPDITTIPFLETMREEHPIKTVKGLPVLTQELMWNDDVPLFVTGALAGLRLGPGAGNLAGARVGAERIAWGLEGVLARDGECEVWDELGRRDSGYASEDDGKGDKDRGRVGNSAEVDYARGVGSRFEALNMLDGDE